MPNHDLKSILEAVLRQFPELRSKDIQVEWLEQHESFFTYSELDPEGWCVECNPELKTAPEGVLMGGIAHELCHILEDCQLTRRLKFRDRLAYTISKRYKTLDERNTDLEVILRGFGHALLTLMQYAEDEGYDYYEEDGLSVRELKIIIENV